MTGVMTMAEPKLWTKDFIIISGANFFLALTFLLLMTNMAVYAIEEFNASPGRAGQVSGIFIVGTLTFRLFAGRYIERIGRKRMLFGGLVLFLLASLLYFVVVENLNLLLLVRFVHGAAFGAAATAMATIVMNIIPRARLGEGTSYFTMSATLAMAVGPFLGIFVSQRADFTMMFAICAFFSIVSLIISLFSNIPEAGIGREQLEAMKSFKLSNFFEQKAIPIAIMIFIVGFAFSGVLSFLTSYTREIGLIETASFFFIVFAVFILISRPFTGRLYDRRGANHVIYPALIIYALGLLFLSQVHHGYTLLLAGAVSGLGYGTLISCSQAVAVQEAPRHRIGLATSTFFIGLDGGVGIGPLLLGYIIPVVSFRGLYMTMAAVILACILLYYLLHGRKESYKKQYSVADC